MERMVTVMKKRLKEGGVNSLEGVQGESMDKKHVHVFEV